MLWSMAETTVLDQYGPRIIDVSASNDGSLTKADITAFTPAKIVEFKDLAVAESEMYRQLTVSRLTGVKEMSLYDLLLSRMTNISPEFRKDGPRGQTYFRPYILRKQEDVVNTNNFAIDAGEAAAGAGGALPSSAWQVTVSSKALGAAANAHTDGVANEFQERPAVTQRTFVVKHMNGERVDRPK